MCEEEKTNPVETAWQVVGMVTVVAILITVISFALAPHKVTAYYLGSDANNGMATCVYADTTWAPDNKCYCVNNPQQAIEDIKNLNAAIKP